MSRRRLLACVAATLMASGCITVGDFGAYRDRDPLDGDRLELLETPDVEAIGTARPQPPSIAYARRAETPAISIKTLDQAALDWLAHVYVTAQPDGVYTRRR